MNEADDTLNFSYVSQSKTESRIALHVVQQFPVCSGRLCWSHLRSALSSYPPISRRHRATIMAWQ